MDTKQNNYLYLYEVVNQISREINDSIVLRLKGSKCSFFPEKAKHSINIRVWMTTNI